MTEMPTQPTLRVESEEADPEKLVGLISHLRRQLPGADVEAVPT